MPTSEQNDHIDDLFLKIVGVTPQERLEIIDDLDVADEIRAILLDMLRADEELQHRESPFLRPLPICSVNVDDTAVANDLPIPFTKLGGYQLMEVLGRGGMGVVYKARHHHMKRLVAVKVLPRKALSDPQATSRFQREIEVVASLRHENIVTAFDANVVDDVHFLVLEYVDGVNLHELVQKSGPLTIDVAINYIIQAARGLSHAHKNGVIHRDVKPANLLADNQGIVKVLDLGLARTDQPQEAEIGLTETGLFMGTADYAAPEMALGPKRADARTDVYGLGCTMFYLLTGQRVYDGATKLERILAHRENDLPSLRDSRPGIPMELETIFSTMIQKDPAERLQSMDDVIAQLTALADPPDDGPLSDAPLSDAPLSNAPLSDRPLDGSLERIRKSRVVPVLLSVLVVIGIAVGIAVGVAIQTGRIRWPSSSRVVGKDEAERELVRWIFEVDGLLGIAPDGYERRRSSLDEMPANGFELTHVYLANSSEVRDADMQRFVGADSIVHIDLASLPALTGEGLKPLRNLENLAQIHINQVGAGDGLHHLSQLENLSTLRFLNSDLSNDGLLHVAGLTSLEYLWLDGNARISDSGIRHLSGLRELRGLSLSGSAVSDGCVVFLRDMPYLQELFLHETSVTDKGEANLKADHPDLEIVR